MKNNILKSLPVKANLDNQVPYASYPSADNINLTDAQYATRLAQADSVNKDMVQNKSSIGTNILFGIGGICVLVGCVWGICCIVNGREQRLAEKAKADERIRAAKEIEEEKRKTAEERAKLRYKAKNPENRYGTIPVSGKGETETEADPIAKYIDAYNKSKNRLNGIRYSNLLPRSNQPLCGNLMQPGDIVGICSDSGVGKSIFAMDLSLALASRKHFSAMPLIEGKEPIDSMQVLYLSSEEMLGTFNERNPENWLDLVDYHDKVYFDNPYDCAREIYKQLCSINKNCFIVLDSITLMFPEKMRGESVTTFIQLIKLMQFDIATRGLNWTFLLTFQPTKAGVDKQLVKRNLFAGSVNWDREADTMMVLSYGNKKDERCLHPLKCRNVPNERDLTYVMRIEKQPYLHYEYERTEGLPQRKNWKKLCRHECERIQEMYQRGMKISEIAHKTGRDYNTIKKVLKQHQ